MAPLRALHARLVLILLQPAQSVALLNARLVLTQTRLQQLLLASIAYRVLPVVWLALLRFLLVRAAQQVITVLTTARHPARHARLVITLLLRAL